MQRVVYNACYGGFGLHEDVVKWVRENEDQLSNEYSDEAVEDLADVTISGEYYSDGSGPKGDYMNYIHGHEVERDNELLADVVAGETAYNGDINGSSASSLRVAEVPNGVDWTIDERDGQETVKERTQTFS